MNTIYLGNSDNPKNHIKINDPSVSKNHLEITWVNYNSIIIKDLDSTNGTKVNNLLIKSKQAGPYDTVQIGHTKMSVRKIIKQCMPLVNKDKMLFLEEFKSMEPLFEEYKKTQAKIQSSHTLNLTIIRISLPLLLIALFMLFGEQMGIDPQYRLIIPLVGGGIASYFADKVISKEKLKEKQQLVKDEYDDWLVCPKCAISLTNNTVTYWKKRGTCSNCQAIWV